MNEPPARPSERAQRQIERFLDASEAAMARFDWEAVRDNAQAVLRLDPDNPDALAFLAAASRRPDDGPLGLQPMALPAADGAPTTSDQPASFVGGRYSVVRLLGEGATKRVYRAHDTKLDRDVAFALIKSDGLDADGLTRIRREAQAMARLGDHPNIVAVHDIGDEAGQPYIVSQFMAGGDLQRLIEQAPEHRIPLEQATQIADQVCQALEHAHTHGVIHRDLKPGNVWLSAGPTAKGETDSNLPTTSRPSEIGTAKLGDFGLAIALDRSRLTQAGMMVGTVAYMAPEQALGGEVTARSDLYSLGALLYELVTGRPPFVGDESVAIITQHLNTPPVAPSWHVPDLPQGLEALILRLLEKDPEKRPESANQVAQALAASHTDGRHGEQPSAAASSVGSPAPAYRRVFVGREAELRQAQNAFDRSQSGEGSLLLVVGEPGIGKTALCEQLATYVAVRGGKFLVGHCYEEGSLSLPYLAFVEALRTHVLAREPEALKQDLGTGGPEVARIISEVRERANVEPRPQLGDPEEERWRLLQAVTSFLRNAATVQPLVVVLEDLHWADRGTLDLLLHVARNLRGARLLIVGTYRDVEVDRTHPLSAALAELRRIAELERVLLRGLTVDEVHRMMNIIRGQEVPWSRAEAIFRQTEGNPLFVQEVLRFIVEEGQLVREGGRYVRTSDDPEAGIPEGLREVVGKRLNRLGERTNLVLSVAAVMGREFRLDVLQKVAGMGEDEIDASLQEALGRDIVEERSALGVLAFRFTHAFFRQALYEEIFASRRLRLHQQVARGLEEVYARRLEEHASELAEHFAQSTDSADLEKALGYSELAAKRAMSVFAYGEAMRHLEQALKIQDVLDPDNKVKRCDLLLALGEAMLPMDDPRQVANTVAGEAFALAEAIDDSTRAARASVQALEAFMRVAASMPATWRSPEVAEWVVGADRHAQVGTVERVYADIAQGLHTMRVAGVAAGHVFLRRAVERAEDLGDNAAFFAAAAWALSNLLALRDRDLRRRLAHEVALRRREGVRSRDLAQCLEVAAPLLLADGERELAERLWREGAQLVERTRDATLAVRAMRSPILLAGIDGRLEEALSLREAYIAQAESLGLSALLGAAMPLLLLGRTSELPARFEAPDRAIQSRRAAIMAHLGRSEEARAIRERFGDIGSPADETSVPNLVALLEASVIIRDHETVGALVRRLAPLAEAIELGALASIGRLLGDGERLLGHPDEAHSYYAQALEVCEKIRFRPEIALIRLHQAELLLEHYPDEHAEALDHLDFATKEFEAMKMAPSLERAQALRAKVGA